MSSIFFRSQNSRAVAHVAISLIVLILFPSVTWSQTNGHFSTIAVGDEAAAPGAGDTKFATFGTPQIDAAGKVAFMGTLQVGGAVTSSNDSGIWGPDVNGILSLIAREGAGGVPGGAGLNFTHFNTSEELVLGSGGVLAFSAHLTGPGTSAANDVSLLRYDAQGNLSMIARSGSGGVPEVAGADYSSTLGGLVVSSNGAVAFRGELTIGPGGATATNNTGIWGVDADRNSLLWARTGSANPPGFTGTTRYSEINNPAVINGQDIVGFKTYLTGSGVTAASDQMLYGPNASGDLMVIVREGNVAAGTSGAQFTTFESLSINDAGQAVFNNHLKANVGDTISNVNDFGLWTRDANGTLSMVARIGSGNVPGVAGADFKDFGTPVLNATGKVAFVGTLSTGVGGVTAANDAGVWGLDVAAPGLTLLAREGGDVPGLTGAKFATITVGVNINAAGNVLYGAQLQNGVGGITSNNDRGYWITDGIETFEVIREGRIADGRTIKDGILVQHSGGGQDGRATGLNDFGQVAYRARFSDNREAVQIWTPELHWRGTAGDGLWNSDTNWTLSLKPGAVHDVYFDPTADTNLTTTGNIAVANLTIGGGAGQARVQFNAGSSLVVDDTLAVKANGGFAFNGTTLAVGSLNVEGTLINNGSIAGTVEVADGALVKGSGSFGTLHVHSGGAVSPGNSPGTITDAVTSWDAGAKYVWEINSLQADGGNAGFDPGWDLWNTGDLTIGGPFTVELHSLTGGNVAGALVSWNSNSSYSWLIATSDNGAFDSLAGLVVDSSLFDDFNSLAGTFGFFSTDGNDLYLSYAAVPEPSSCLLASFAAAGLGWRIRRRHSKSV